MNGLEVLNENDVQEILSDARRELEQKETEGLADTTFIWHDRQFYSRREMFYEMENKTPIGIILIRNWLQLKRAVQSGG